MFNTHLIAHMFERVTNLYLLGLYPQKQFVGLLTANEQEVTTFIQMSLYNL